MNQARVPFLACVLVALLGSASAAAQSNATPTSFQYKPPDRGAPQARVSGGTRSPGDPQVAIRVLAPDHVGLTIRQQPTLYWYVSKSVDKPIVVTVVDDAVIDPVLEARLEPPFAAGIQALPLADHGVRLEAGKTYQWGVALVSESDDRFKDIYAGGAVGRVAPDAALGQALATSTPASRARVLAEAGIWYDAIHELTTFIAQAPQGHEAHRQRRSLLEQVGLPRVAQVDSR